MKTYPSVPYPTEEMYGRDCIGFMKLDGSNIRAEWNRKRGWYKFGTRHRLFDTSDPEYGCAIDIFLNKYGDAIPKALPKVDSLIAFAEFFGPHSFAGQHDIQRLNVESNDPKQVVLFDVNVHKKGIIGPKEFIKTFGHLHIPDVVYEGKLTEEFEKAVEEGNYPVGEGVIVKGMPKSQHSLWMAKIKTKQYKDKLITFFGQSWQQYW